MTSRLLLVCLLVMIGHVSAQAQDRCGTVQYNNLLKKAGRIPANDALFENWLKDKATTLRTSNAKREKGAPYKIPVVVHVVHNGEGIGTGTNISDAQIFSQISVLNEDFRRMNADASKTPADFLNVAGSIDIEFVLAKSDPEGLPTSGIVRVKGTKPGWVLMDQYELKALSYWPAEDYLNLWVCDQVDDLAGYGQYPESSLPGVDNSSINRLTDGVVVWYRAFGSVDDGNFNLSSTFNKGRTLTHELGHFFGLRHIWGDDSGGCESDDFVNDTPKQAGNSSGCPTHPRTSCGTVNMFQNYMDYTTDACMNLFTKDQAARMALVLENSPRRVSLLTSPGLNDPLIVQNDLGIYAVFSPQDFQCSTTFTPTIVVKNYGTANINSAKITMLVNGLPAETLSAVLNLSNLASTTLSFSPVSVTTGNNEIEFEITEVNGGSDENPNNNDQPVSFLVPDQVTTPFSENFNTFPSLWTIRNPDGKKTWEIVTAPRETPANKAIRINLFDYDESYGEVDILTSPAFDLSTAPVASLMFDVAFARYLSSNDRLKVVVLKDCQSIEDGTVVLDLAGNALKTVNPPSGSFVPAGTNEWRREFINLTAFIGEPNIQLAFVAISDWGNNLYLDNISILTTALEDVELQGIVAPTFITCNPSPSPTVVFQNVGTKVITSLTVQYAVNGAGGQFTVSSLNVPLGDEFQIQLPPLALNLTAITNTVSVTLLNPNGQPDQSPTNNTKNFQLIFDDSSDKIPLRQNFNSGFGAWRTLNIDGGKTWETTTTNFNGSVYFNAHNNINVNQVAWLVSPVLDFSGTNQASLVYDLSYRQRAGRKERLQLYGSRDCGNTFEEVSTIALPNSESPNAWAPVMQEDWSRKNIINLDQFAGESEVRLAFAVVNDNGNNLFLDNLEIFVSNDPVIVDITDEYNVYGYNLSNPADSDLKLTFNLPVRNEVEYTLVDLMGKIQDQAVLPDVLNQTYQLDGTKQLAAGTYVLKLRIGRQMHAERILIVR